MTEPLSDAQLAEIRARKAAATGGGRWILVAGRTIDDVTVKAIIGEDEVVIGSLDFGAGPGARDDKTFVVTAGRDIAALLAEVDRLAAESEQRLGELLFWHFEFQDAMDNYRGEAQHVKKLAAESESRRQAAAANAASIAVLQRQINEQASELDRLRTELAVEQAKVRGVETVKCWVNEDRQRFVFAEDLAVALGYTPTDAAPAEPTCGVLNPKVAATCTEPTEHPSPIHRDAFGNTWYRRDGERPLAADPFEGHFVHCYIREGAHCSCGRTTPVAPTA